MKRKYWGICKKCSKWGEAPSEFNESKHFLKCECGSLMYLDIHNPKEAAYQDKDKVIVIIVNQ